MRTRRQPKCTLCTKYRWLGNAKQRFAAKDGETRDRMGRDAREAKRRPKRRGKKP